MPTYVYRCNDCEYEFEKRQSMTADPLTDCPRCDDGAVRRVINSVGIVFKGRGFYVTDNRNGSGPSSNGSSANGAGETTPTGEKKVDEKKSESKTTETEAP